HVLRIFVAPDEGRKIAPILEKQWRCRRRRTNVKASHRTKKFCSGNPLNSRVDRDQRVDQANGHVIAIDVVSLKRTLAARPHYPAWCRTRGVRQPRCKTVRETRSAPVFDLLKRHVQRSRFEPNADQE